MISYEVTIEVRDDLKARYEVYMRERHIPDLLQTGLFAGARFLVEQKRRTFDIRRMLVTLNGDMISGYIHPELVEANSMSPVKEVLFAAKHIIRGLRNLLEIDGLQIHVEDGAYDHAAFRPWRLLALAFKALRALAPEYPLWRDFPYEYVFDKLAIDVINGGPQLREWVDDAAATPADLDARRR